MTARGWSCSAVTRQQPAPQPTASLSPSPQRLGSLSQSLRQPTATRSGTSASFLRRLRTRLWGSPSTPLSWRTSRVLRCCASGATPTTARAPAAGTPTSRGPGPSAYPQPTRPSAAGCTMGWPWSTTLPWPTRSERICGSASLWRLPPPTHTTRRQLRWCWAPSQRAAACTSSTGMEAPVTCQSITQSSPRSYTISGRASLGPPPPRDSTSWQAGTATRPRPTWSPTTSPRE
mmetsp:Transcript_63715/g.201503  ORF Transcript_63715/g.201503 Transcript_63715/m.201503 type:complete len:232 (-) Transcript_63715:1713-2408(-)